MVLNVATAVGQLFLVVATFALTLLTVAPPAFIEPSSPYAVDMTPGEQSCRSRNQSTKNNKYQPYVDSLPYSERGDYVRVIDVNLRACVPDHSRTWA